jgi:carbamate kinase
MWIERLGVSVMCSFQDVVQMIRKNDMVTAVGNGPIIGEMLIVHKRSILNFSSQVGNSLFFDYIELESDCSSSLQTEQTVRCCDNA